MNTLDDYIILKIGEKMFSNQMKDLANFSQVNKRINKICKPLLYIRKAHYKNDSFWLPCNDIFQDWNDFNFYQKKYYTNSDMLPSIFHHLIFVDFNQEIFNEIIQKDFNLNISRKIFRSSTPLIATCKERKSELIDLFCHHGANVELRDQHCISPLEAIFIGNGCNVTLTKFATLFCWDDDINDTSIITSVEKSLKILEKYNVNKIMNVKIHKKLMANIKNIQEYSSYVSNFLSNVNTIKIPKSFFCNN